MQRAELFDTSGVLDDMRLFVEAANTACRGRKATLAERLHRAAVVEARCLRASAYEHQLTAMLRARRLKVVQQKAIGPYNCDLTVGSVAVEVWAGNWNGGSRHPGRATERLRYFLYQGWHVLAVKVNRAGRHALTERTADYVADFICQVRRNPPQRCEYRVIGGDGETLAAGGPQDAELAFVHPFRLTRDPRTGRYQRAGR